MKMVTPAFGFSVGDFITAINLINQVRKSLKDVGGASSEYQSAVIELENLATTLSHLEALQPDEDNAQHINAIRAMAMACKYPLDQFRTKMARYESALGPTARRSSLYTMSQKAKWSVLFAEDVEKLRAVIAAKHVSINLLLGMQNSKTLSKLNEHLRSGIQGLEKKVAEQHEMLNNVQEVTRNMDSRTKSAQKDDHEMLTSIHARVDKMELSVIQTRHFGQQIMNYLNTFPRKIQQLLRAVLQSNLQIYQIVLQMQQNIPARPTNLLESNIRFEDALGEIKELPYEYFREWEPFEGFLRAHFRHKPGESNILDSQYYILDKANNDAVVRKDHWTRYIREGTKISMSMIMSHIKLQSGICPRPDCSGVGLSVGEISNRLHCKICSLEFFRMDLGLEDSFQRVTILPEDEEISKKQLEEDLNLYGSRPPPPDAVEVDEHAQLSDLPPKRSAAEFDAAVHRPAKLRRRIESEKSLQSEVTAMDWNSGATPLDAWLNQSAVPSIVSVPLSQKSQSGFSTTKLAVKELEDLKAFRRIHLEGSEGPKDRVNPQNLAEDFSKLQPKLQIYLRNILDRYPLLPSYLALRLAEANCARADRLDLERHSQSERFVSKPVHSRWRNSMDNTPPTPGLSERNQDGTNNSVIAPKLDKVKRHTCVTCSRNFGRFEHLKRHERMHLEDRSFKCEECSRCFTRRDLLLRHQQRLHMTSLPSFLGRNPQPSKQPRYHVALNTQTAMIKHADEIPITYLNEGQAYIVTISDTQVVPTNILSRTYRITVGISFDDEQQREDPSTCWQNWKEGRGLSEAYLRGGKLQAIENLGVVSTIHKDVSTVQFETAGLNYFSFVWTSNFVTSDTSCSTSVRLNFLSTDFSYPTDVKATPVRLYAMIQCLTDSSYLASNFGIETCYCKVKLFREHGAERKQVNDVAHVKKSIEKLEKQIIQVEGEEHGVGLASEDVNYRASKAPDNGRILIKPSPLSRGKSDAKEDILEKLAAMQQMLLSSRASSFHNFEEGKLDDPGYKPVAHAEESEFGPIKPSSTRCTDRGKSDHPPEQCPPRTKRKRETYALSVCVNCKRKHLHCGPERPCNSCIQLGEETTCVDVQTKTLNNETAFWMPTRSKSRAASVHSHASERNSSLHGSAHFDPEDQDLDFPDNQSRRSSASFSGSNAAFPPPPMNIKIIEGQSWSAQPFRFFCDICEQEIEVLRRRDWQIHVLEDLKPYVCTFEKCGDPRTQYSSRRQYMVHEVGMHEMLCAPGPEDIYNFVKKKSEEVIMCMFCGERTEGKNNGREKHIGRHLEEIAFAVVRKPYEDWDFYSDSSGLTNRITEADLLNSA